MDLTLRTDVDDRGRRIITLAGSLDLQSRTGLVAEGRQAATAEGSTGVVLNLAGITFIDSSGIGAIVELAGASADADISFSLQDPSARVSRILQITGLQEAWASEPAATES
jgi:anti-sigma B factor antagonist